MDDRCVDEGADGGREPVGDRPTDRMPEGLEHDAHRRILHTAEGQAQAPRGMLSDRGVAWVRISDLISSGAGRVAGRGIDFEAQLARRLRHPADVTRRAIRDRSSSLPPLDAFGRSRPRSGHEALGSR